MASVQENRSKFRHVLDELAMQIYNGELESGSPMSGFQAHSHILPHAQDHAWHTHPQFLRQCVPRAEFRGRWHYARLW